MHKVAYRLSNGERIVLDQKRIIGRGGEAYVFDIGNFEAAKIFIEPNDPILNDDPKLQKAAEERIALQQVKLRDFPFALLPDRVVVPKDLLVEYRGNKVIGYVMELLSKTETLMQYCEADFRMKGGISNNFIADLFLDLHPTVTKIHNDAGVVISDFNNLNVLVQPKGVARIVDADSMGNKKYLSNMFTAFFVDPRLCDKKLTHLELIKPHDFLSDWYAYETMLVEALILVRPWGGVYKPKNKAKRIPLDARPLHNISIFNPEVGYPVDAVPYSVLPDDLLHHFYNTYEKGVRVEFPLKLLDFRFGKCPNCGMEHAKTKCPKCSTASTVQKMTQIRGNVRADYIFRTKGVIVSATVQKGQLKFVYHEDGKFRREDGSVVIEGSLDPGLRYRIQENRTLLAMNGQMFVIENGKVVESNSVGSFGNLPLIDANSKHIYWIYGGVIYRDGEYGPEVMGSVLENQTMFWVGEEFGFGFYRAGNVMRAFVFDAENPGLDDTLKVSPITGTLVDSTCIFSGSRCWFITSEKIGSKYVNKAQLIHRNGTVEAYAEAALGDGSWLGKIRGKLPIGSFVLSATNEGIVRVESSQGTIVTTKEFPDTQPYVDEGSYLLAGGNGISVVQKKEIINLTIR